MQLIAKGKLATHRRTISERVHRPRKLTGHLPRNQIAEMLGAGHVVHIARAVPEPEPELEPNARNQRNDRNEWNYGFTGSAISCFIAIPSRFTPSSMRASVGAENDRRMCEWPVLSTKNAEPVT